MRARFLVAALALALSSTAEAGLFRGSQKLPKPLDQLSYPKDDYGAKTGRHVRKQYKKDEPGWGVHMFRQSVRPLRPSFR
jgi:hypothetical protein